MELIINLIDRHGWEGLYDIYINRPKGAEIFNIHTGEYLSHHYKDMNGTHNWLFYSSLFAEWFSYSTKCSKLLEFNCLISDIKKYADIWERIEFFGGIDAIENNLQYAYDENERVIMIDSISEYHEINKLIILEKV